MRLADDFRFAEVLDGAVKRTGLPQGVAGPPPTWWNSLRDKDVVARAKLFVDEYQRAEADPKYRDQRVATMRSLMAAPGFSGDDFSKALSREFNDRGIARKGL